jgi:hypothetical protein
MPRPRESFQCDCICGCGSGFHSAPFGCTGRFLLSMTSVDHLAGQVDVVDEPSTGAHREGPLVRLVKPSTRSSRTPTSSAWPNAPVDSGTVRNLAVSSPRLARGNDGPNGLELSVEHRHTTADSRIELKSRTTTGEWTHTVTSGPTRVLVSIRRSRARVRWGPRLEVSTTFLFGSSRFT